MKVNSISFRYIDYMLHLEIKSSNLSVVFIICELHFLIKYNNLYLSGIYVIRLILVLNRLGEEEFGMHCQAWVQVQGQSQISRRPGPGA